MKPRPLTATALAGSSRGDDRTLARLRDAMFGAIDPITPPSGRDVALRDRLIGRVRDSIEANRVFVTVRGIDGAWAQSARGVRHKTLHAGEASRSHLIELDAGAVLAPRVLSTAEEWLILDGELEVDAGTGVVTRLPAGAYHRLAAGHPLGRATARRPVRLYRRIVDADHPALPAAEAAWAPAPGSAALTVMPGDDGWMPFADGVTIKPLAGSPDAISILARFEPGASVPGHGHGIDEECVMLDGELFLGDVLLRQAEFQLAPAGTTHEPLVSDVGCVLFFHGAIDPSLR